MKQLFSIAVLIVFLCGLFSSCQKSYESVPLGQQVTLDLAFDTRDSLGKQAMAYLLTTYQQALYNGHNRVNGNYLDAEMVKAFIESAEYRQRFGP